MSSVRLVFFFLCAVPANHNCITNINATKTKVLILPIITDTIYPTKKSELGVKLSELPCEQITFGFGFMYDWFKKGTSFFSQSQKIALINKFSKVIYRAEN